MAWVYRAGTLPTVVAQAVATIALGLLGASGVAKLVDPEPTTGAMRAARLPSSNAISQSLGVVEIVAAVAGLAVGGITVLLGAGLYAAFVIFTITALSNRIPLQSCGCFGREDTPPTAVHVAYNAVSALGLLALPLLGADPIDWGLPTTTLALYAGFAAVGVWASYLTLTLLPRLMTPVSHR